MGVFRTVYIFTPGRYVGVWIQAVLCLLCLFCAFITLLLAYQGGRFARAFFTKTKQSPYILSGILFVWTAIGFTFVSSGFQEYQLYQVLVSDYQQGRYEIAEGRVQVISQQAREGRSSLEQIVVAGTTFTFSAFEYSPGYQTPISRGGILREGVYVRLYHKDGYILRIDMWGAPAPTLVPPVPPRTWQRTS